MKSQYLLLLFFFSTLMLCAHVEPTDTLCTVVSPADDAAPLADDAALLAADAAPFAADAVAVDTDLQGVPSSCAGTLADFRDASTAFRPRQLAFPAVALALGGAGVRSHLVDTSSPREHWTTIDDGLQYVPVVAYAGLGFIPGVRHDHAFGDRFLAGATAFVFMTGVCQGLKCAVGEPRPDASGDNSFPSGHTAKAFCGAELTRIEYGNAYGAAAYAFAVTTAALRVVNNRHWCNDVLAGAGIGLLSAHVGYWLLPYEKRLVCRVFGRGSRRSSADGRQPACTTPFVLAPAYDYLTKAPSLSFVMHF